MSLILSGTNGLSDVDGSAATPAIRGTDTNTGIFFPAADTIAFAEGGVEAMRLDSSGNLGIGTTSPTGGANRVVDVYGSGSSAINFHNATSGTTSTDGGVVGQYGSDLVLYNYEAGIIQFGTSNAERMRLDASGNLGLGTTSPTSYGSAYSVFEVAGSVSGVINVKSGSTLYGQISNGTNLFKLDAVGASSSLLFLTNTTERARIDSSGNLLIGTTSGSRPLCVATSDNRANLYLNSSRSSVGSEEVARIEFTASAPNNTTSWFIYANDTSAQRFSVRSNGGIANFSANNVNLSDRREKTNFAPAGEYLSKICAIPVQTFNYIDQNMEDDPGTTLGVVAQDVQAVAPELVMESNWGTPEEPKMRLSIYQTDLQYALMKCIQEQQAIIEQLQADVAALKAKA